MNRVLAARKREVVGLVALVLATLFLPSACAGPDAAIGPRIPQEGGGTVGGGTAAGVLAFLVQPNDAAAGSPIEPDVKVEALDSFGHVLTGFAGTVRVALGSNASGGSLRSAVRWDAWSGVAFSDTLVLHLAGHGFTLIA